MTTTPPAPPAPLLLPGQAAAVPGPCDMTGMYVVHHAFRRDVARFAEAARRTPCEAGATWVATTRRWALFARELHQHHAKEDAAIWPLLLERVDTTGRQVLEAMEAEHERIDPLLADVADDLRLLARGTAGSAVRERLVATLDELAQLLDQHLAHEETTAIALIQQHLTADEWAHLEATALRGTPSPRRLMLMLPWVTDGLPEAARDRLLDGAPPPVLLMLRLGRRAYDRLERRAFGDLPPRPLPPRDESR
jgi:hypothetical protein